MEGKDAVVAGGLLQLASVGTLGHLTSMCRRDMCRHRHFPHLLRLTLTAFHGFSQVEQGR
jgi:hypothetical protein